MENYLLSSLSMSMWLNSKAEFDSLATQTIISKWATKRTSMDQWIKLNDINFMLCFVWFMLLHNLGSLVNLLLRFDEEFRVEFLKFAEKLYLSKYPSFAWFHHISLSRTMKKAQRREKRWTMNLFHRNGFLYPSH